MKIRTRLEPQAVPDHQLRPVGCQSHDWLPGLRTNTEQSWSAMMIVFHVPQMTGQGNDMRTRRWNEDHATK